MVIVLYLQLVHAIMEAHNKKLSVMLKAHVDPVSKYFSFCITMHRFPDGVIIYRIQLLNNLYFLQ
jgi:hypothetical protein